jgi:hypothetical protein
MSRKYKIESENIDIENDTLGQIIDVVRDNKLLIGGLALASGAAIYLLATESGKRLREEIQDRAADAYDVISEQVTKGLDRLNEITQDVLSSEEGEKRSENIRKIA